MSRNNYETGSVTATGTICSSGMVDAVLPATAAVAGTFVGTCKVEISMDPDATSPTWVQFGSDLTAPGVIEVTVPAKAVRIRCSAFTSGTIVGMLGVGF